MFPSLLLLFLSLSLGFLTLFSLLSPLAFPSFSDKLYLKLRKISPKIDCLILFYKNRHRLLNWYTELLSQSPSQTIVVHRLGAPRTVVTANPANVEYILKTNFHNFPKGKPFTDLLGDFLGLGIFNVDGDAWSAQRKMASHVFTARLLREFSLNVLEDEVERRLVPILEDAARNGTVLDMQEVLRRFSFDAICRVSLGVDPACLDLSKPPPPLAAAFDAASEISAARGASPVFAVWKLKRLLNVGRERDLKDAIKIVRGCVDEIIRTKRDNITADKDQIDGDLLSKFLRSGMGDRTVRDMVISFLMAGRDTTSSAVTWLLWLLSNHRETERRVVDEISSKQGGKSGKLGYDELKEMNFVKACLCESMRLYPPVVWDSKHPANDDVLPDGTRVRRGDRVTYFQYGMGRMERIWGKDRFEFQPDRWLDENGAAKIVSPYEYPVFQAGPRVCLGKEMAYVQMKYLVAAVVGRFELEPVRTEAPVFVPLLTAYMAGGFKVRIRRRGA